MNTLQVPTVSICSFLFFLRFLHQTQVEDCNIISHVKSDTFRLFAWHISKETSSLVSIPSAISLPSN